MFSLSNSLPSNLICSQDATSPLPLIAAPEPAPAKEDMAMSQRAALWQGLVPKIQAREISPRSGQIEDPP